MIKAKKWIIPPNNNPKAEHIAEKFSISPIIASLILNRGYETDEDVKNFLYTDVSQFLDPFELSGMKNAVNYINDTIKSNKKIAVYGDYDVDGITSTYILYDYLKGKGANVSYYIPDRASEGYGINKDAVDILSNENVSLIITVDVGITAYEEVEYGKGKNVEFIITDHHTPKDKLPQAISVINPKISTDKYENKNLAGCGVAFKLVYALSGCDKKIIDKYCEAAAIGTIADMVDLKGENRFITSYGLEHLRHSESIGLCSLMKVAGIQKENIVSSNVGFGLAPRLNAAGRIASAKSSVSLFLEKDEQKATEIAEYLDKGNKLRQNEEQHILDEALEKIESESLYNDNVIIVAGRGWHHGIIGIVSSKITEKYYKPSAVLSINDDNSVKASGRSINGFNLFDALSASSEYLTKFGGHDLAAGFSLCEENIDLFRKKINDYAKGVMTEEILTPKLFIDAEINASDITTALANEIKILEPYGIGNRTPVFCVNDVTVKSIKIHRLGKHAFISLEKNYSRFDAPAFNMAETVSQYTQGEKICIAGTIGINFFRGIENVQFIIRDIRCAEECGCNKQNLRKLFVILRNFMQNNINNIKIDDIALELGKTGVSILGKSGLKTALEIFNELNLISSKINSDTLSLSPKDNFIKKCKLEDSYTYRQINKIEI